jgi:RES domain-containing protein
LITVSRICADAFKDSIFTGKGAFLNGGRWNSQGNRVVYTAQSLSLATLELLVHLDARQIKNNFVYAEAKFQVDIVSEIDLSQTWLTSASPDEFKVIGDRWIRDNKSAILRVPSILSKQEYNYLFNPKHPDFSKITLHETAAFTFVGEASLKRESSSTQTRIVDCRDS